MNSAFMAEIYADCVYASTCLDAADPQRDFSGNSGTDDVFGPPKLTKNETATPPRTSPTRGSTTSTGRAWMHTASCVALLPGNPALMPAL